MRFLATIALLASAAAADTVTLRDGRTLSGRATPDERGGFVVVDRDQKYVVPKADVAKFETGRSFMDEYEERLGALDPDDAEAIYEFGRWLEENEWPTRARRAYEEVILLDPDHKGARRALGFKLFEGAWVSPEELNRRNGLVEYEGGWYTEHDLAELKAEISRNERLRNAMEDRSRTREKVNSITRRFATFDKEERAKAHRDLYAYAEQVNSPELRKFADDAKAYYDNWAKVLCARMLARTEIKATLTRLKKPIDTFQTSLGQAIGFVSGQNPVTIQLPELSVASVSTTVDIPAGCK
jgi:hypothetical protein